MQSPSVVRIAFALAVVVFFLGAGFGSASLSPGGRLPSGTPTPPSAEHSSVPASPSQQLADAESSLATGAGPAGGLSLRCDAVGSSVSCADAAHPAAGLATIGTWSNVTSRVTNALSGRIEGAMAWDPTDGYALLFGGVACGGTCAPHDTWTFADGVWTNITASVTGSPSGIVLEGLAFDPSTGKVILFSGERASAGFSSATWTYSAKTWTNISSTVGSTPPARVFPAMVTDSTDGEVVLTGGETSGGYPSDTWVFKDGTWTNDTSIAGRAGNLFLPVASNDPPEDGVLLFGSEYGNQTRTATLVYSSGSWHNLTSTLSAPAPALYLGNAEYLSGPQAVVAFSGITINSTGSNNLPFVTWEFEAGRWSNITDLVGAPPTAVFFLEHVVDPVSDAIVVFGGYSLMGPLLSPYTYEFSAPPTVTASVSKSVIDAGSSVTLTATVSGGLAPNTVSWNFGDGSANASGTSLAHAYTSPGLVVATVTVTSFVDASSTATVVLDVNPALALSDNASATPTAGTPTTFSSLVSGGTAPFTYAWSFGDTSTSSASSLADPSHTYASSGTYTVTLKVTDSLGSSVNKTLSVAVASAPSTSSTSLTSGTGLGLLIGIIVLLLVVIALAVMLMRKPKSPVMMAAAASVPPYTPPSAPPPPPPA